MPNLLSSARLVSAPAAFIMLSFASQLSAQDDRCKQAEERETAEYNSRMRALAQKQAAADEQRTRDLQACGIANQTCKDAADRRQEERLKKLELEGNDEKTRHSKAKVDVDLACATYEVAESGACRGEQTLRGEYGCDQEGRVGHVESGFSGCGRLPGQG